MAGKIALFVLPLICLFGMSSSAKILFFGAFGSDSTRISQWPLMSALADKGHEVTFLSPYKTYFEQDAKKKSKIIPYVPEKLYKSMQEFKESWESELNVYDMRRNESEGGGISSIINLSVISEMFDYGIVTCEALYSDEDFVKWVKSNKFDLVVVETFMNECAYGMIHKWGAKLAVYSTATVMSWHYDAFGLPDESSTTTDMLLKDNDGANKSFIKRLGNAMIPIIVSYFRDYQYIPKLEEITKKALGDYGKDIPSFKEIEKNNSLLLLTSHYSLDDPRSLPPHAIPIGGIVVAKEKKPLPAEMEKFVNSGKQGFIYISFGTIVDFSHIERKVQVEFINALGAFPEMRFIWKLQKNIEGVKIPGNVLVTKWAPQQTILGHDKLKAFVTHSGMGSTAEAVHFGVPLVCIPIFADQDINADVIVRKGAGVKVEILDMKQSQLENAIKEILYNPKYRNGMTTLSKVFHDRPIPPFDNAVWWIEYILRHDNIRSFISPPNIHQSWWVRRQVDVWLVVGALLLSASMITLWVVCKTMRLIISMFGSSDSGRSKKLKRN